MVNTEALQYSVYSVIKDLFLKLSFLRFCFPYKRVCNDLELQCYSDMNWYFAVQRQPSKEFNHKA